MLVATTWATRHYSPLLIKQKYSFGLSTRHPEAVEACLDFDDDVESLVELLDVVEVEEGHHVQQEEERGRRVLVKRVEYGAAKNVPTQRILKSNQTS